MTRATIDRQLGFLIEIDRLKNVVRQSPLLDESRRENSAEHSWHLAMYALVLAPYANEPIDISRVVTMLLLHDLVEIDVGDTPIHQQADVKDQHEREAAAALRIFGLLPREQGDEWLRLWHEFEAKSSPDARFAKALDRLQPLIHNVVTGGGTWNDSNVSQAQVDERYGSEIDRGARDLWVVAKELVRKHFSSIDRQNGPRN